MRFTLGLIALFSAAACAAVSLMTLPTGRPGTGLQDLDVVLAEAGTVSNSGTERRPVKLVPAESPQPGKRSLSAADGAAVITDSIGTARSQQQTGATVPAPRQSTSHNRALALQKELRRVGCYNGDLSGEWSSATRAAMVAFLQQTNALLPTDEPDDILLTLVQGQTTPTCSVSCPAGQSMIEGGRCLPTVAQTRDAPTVNGPPPAKPAWGATSSKSAETNAHWLIVVTPAQLPASRVVVVAPGPTPVTAPGVSATPISGRMAIGAAVGSDLPPALPAVPAPDLTVGQSTGIEAESVTSGLTHASGELKVRRSELREQSTKPHRDTGWTASFFDRR